MPSFEDPDTSYLGSEKKKKKRGFFGRFKKKKGKKDKNAGGAFPSSDGMKTPKSGKSYF